MTHLRQVPFFYSLLQLLGANGDLTRLNTFEKPVFFTDSEPAPKPVPDLRDMVRKGATGPLFVAFDFERSVVPELAQRPESEGATILLFDR